MKKELIMPAGNLEDIVGRLTYCGALLDAVICAMGDNSMVDALSGVHDLLNVICRDFQADIDCAEVHAEKGRMANTPKPEKLYIIVLVSIINPPQTAPPTQDKINILM